MPIYEFVCLDCGNQFEKIQSFSDTTTPYCLQCHSARVQKRLSPPAVHFKGSGWYVTDSKNGSKSASSKGAPDTSNNTESTGKPVESSSKNETKPAAKEPAG
jgi:putative FmdB family regulatory protein